MTDTERNLFEQVKALKARVAELEGRQRHRVVVQMVHHEMSGHGGDPEVTFVPDPKGEWVRYKEKV